MLQIERKIRRIFSAQDPKSEWYRAEDVLVAAVFGLAQHLPFEALMAPILSKAISPPGWNKIPFPTDQTEEDIDRAELWPSFTELREWWESGNGNSHFHGGNAPDGCWKLKDHVILLEAKKLGAKFDKPQLEKYTNFVAELSKQNKRLNHWLLIVGKGNGILHSVQDISPKQLSNFSLLYISWSDIECVVSGLVKEPTTFVDRALKDLKHFLQNADLNAFHGFVWPWETFLDADSTINRILESSWFPHSIWPLQHKELSRISSPNLRNWLKRNIWINLDYTVSTLPINWIKNTHMRES